MIGKRIFKKTMEEAIKEIKVIEITILQEKAAMDYLRDT